LTESVGQLSGLAKVRLDEVEQLDIALVIRSVIQAERDADVPIASAVPAGLRGVGCAADLAVVLHTLIRLAQGDAVVIRGREEHGFVVVSVEATAAPPNGPGVASLHDSLDLEVATRLMADQGGTIWIGGGASQGLSFGVRLPAAPVADVEMEKGASS
jgi:hypothetical protein